MCCITHYFHPSQLSYAKGASKRLQSFHTLTLRLRRCRNRNETFHLNEQPYNLEGFTDHLAAGLDCTQKSRPHGKAVWFTHQPTLNETRWFLNLGLPVDFINKPAKNKQREKDNIGITVNCISQYRDSYFSRFGGWIACMQCFLWITPS